jgi:hypothetical protein
MRAALPRPTSLADPAFLKAEICATLASLARELPLQALPELVGELARVQAIASMRYSGLTERREHAESALLTVEQVATRLGGISVRRSTGSRRPDSEARPSTPCSGSTPPR